MRRSKRIGTIVIVLALAVTAATGALACGGSGDEGDGSSSEKIVIGAALGLVGDAAPGDVPASEAMKYEVAQINEAGGIDGRQVELIVKDMKSDPALGGTVTQELLDAGAQVIIAPAFPGMGAGVVQTAAKAGVPVLSATSTQPEYVVVGGSKAYLVAFGDNVQAAASAEYALGQGFKTAYTLTSPDLSYTELAAQVLHGGVQERRRHDHRRRRVQHRPAGLRRPGDQDPGARPAARRHLHEHVPAGRRRAGTPAAQRRRQGSALRRRRLRPAGADRPCGEGRQRDRLHDARLPHPGRDVRGVHDRPHGVPG